MTNERGVLELAARQGGVVTLAQTAHLGFSPRMRQRRLSAGLWTPIGRLGYRLITLDDELSLLRAAVTLLPGAVVSHWSAARLHRVPARESRPTVTVHTRTTHVFPGVDVRRGHDIVESHREMVEGLLTTTIARTAVDLAPEHSERQLSRLVQDMVIRGRLDLGELNDVVAQVCRRGKPGSAAMRQVLESLCEQHGPQSELERRGRELIAFGMLPEPVHEFPIPWATDLRFDDAFPAARVAIEWDSRSWHASLEAMDSDRRRDRDCVRHGWTLLRFTWRDVTNRQNDVIETVRTALFRSVP